MSFWLWQAGRLSVPPIPCLPTGSPDVLPVGDLGVRKGMQQLYGLKVNRAHAGRGCRLQVLGWWADHQQLHGAVGPGKDRRPWLLSSVCSLVAPRRHHAGLSIEHQPRTHAWLWLAPFTRGTARLGARA